MRTFVGTSGYAYKEWKGNFYPERIAPADMLTHYAKAFKTVEINNTFYRMPTEAVVLQWGKQVPPEFRFVLKASRRITHLKRLKDVSGELEYFLAAARGLGRKLGPVLFQLPPNFKKDLPRLLAFLRLVPKKCRAAVEFRHVSWFDEDVYEVLGDRGAALVVSDGTEKAATVTSTSDWGYLRLRRESYGDDELLDWASRIRNTPWREAFIFFKHEDEGTGPRLGRRFVDLLDAGD